MPIDPTINAALSESKIFCELQLIHHEMIFECSEEQAHIGFDAILLAPLERALIISCKPIPDIKLLLSCFGGLQ